MTAAALAEAASEHLTWPDVAALALAVLLILGLCWIFVLFFRFFR